MIKCAKLKLNKTSMIFLVSRFFHGTPSHISRNTSVPWNIVSETVVYKKLQRICKWNVLIFSSSTISLRWTFTGIISHRKSITAFTDTQFSWLNSLATHIYASSCSPGWSMWSVWPDLKSHTGIWIVCSCCYLSIVPAWQWESCS